MCEVLDRVENKGRLEGYLEGYLEGRAEARAEGIAEERTLIRAMMKNLQITFDEALRILEIPESEKELFI